MAVVGHDQQRLLVGGGAEELAERAREGRGLGARSPAKAITPLRDLGRERGVGRGGRGGDAGGVEETAPREAEEPAPGRQAIGLDPPHDQGGPAVQCRAGGHLLGEPGLAEAGLREHHRDCRAPCRKAATPGLREFAERAFPPEEWQPSGERNARRVALGRRGEPLLPDPGRHRGHLGVGGGVELVAEKLGILLEAGERTRPVTRERQGTHQRADGLPGGGRQGDGAIRERRRAVRPAPRQVELGGAHERPDQPARPLCPLGGEPVLERRLPRHRESVQQSAAHQGRRGLPLPGGLVPGERGQVRLHRIRFQPDRGRVGVQGVLSHRAAHHAQRLVE